MTFKSYYGSTIREALNSARRELGTEAVVLASRQVDPKEGLPGACEVVCGVLDAASSDKKQNNARQSRAQPAAAPPPKKQPDRAVERAAERPVASVARHSDTVETPQESGLSQFRKHVRKIRSAVVGAPAEPDVTDARTQLLIDGFQDELSAAILSGVRRRLREVQRSGGILNVRNALTAEIAERVSVDPALGADGASRKITALVGPPGAGKTSMIVKLAVRYGLTGRKPMRLISLDSARPGGTDALRSYAAGMAVPLDIVTTGAALAQVLEAQPSAGLILIDTPGLGPSEPGPAGEWMAVMARHPEIDVQLAVPATMSAPDLRLTYARFRNLLPSRIVVTKKDCGFSCTAAVALALDNERPLSFLGTGQRIPEDVEPATIDALLGTKASGTGRAAISAA